MSSQQDISFEKLYKMMVFSLRLNRSHPDIPRDLKWVCQFCLMHGVAFGMYCMIIYSTIFHDIRNNNIPQACANGTIGLIFNVVTLKYIILVWHQTELRNMIEQVKNDYALAKSLPPDEYKVVLLFAKKGRTIINIWLKIGVIVATLFPIKSIVLMLFYYIIGEFRYVPYFDITYPDAIEQRKNSFGVYIILYTLFAFYDYYAMFMFIAFSPLGPILQLHICGQLELVRKRILIVFHRNNKDDCIKNLKNISKHLTYINDFATRLNTTLQMFHEFLFKAVAICIPITIYQIIQCAKRGVVSVEFASVIFGTLALCGIPCYYGDILMEKCEGVRMALYSSGWERHCDPDTRTLIRMLLLKTSQPIAMRTLFGHICLHSLTDIFQQAYAIFNVLNAVWH